MSNIRALKSKQVIDGYRTIHDGVVVYADGKIQAVGAQKTTPIPEGAEVVDYGDNVISPGFIDIHIHGYKGLRANSSLENTMGLAEFITQGGTTSFLPTVDSVPGVRYAYEGAELQKKEGYKGAAIRGSQ